MVVVANEGSTARDFLAQERNFLTYVRLSVTLMVMGAAFVLRLRFLSPTSDASQPRENQRWAYDVSGVMLPMASLSLADRREAWNRQLGIVLFAFSLLTMATATSHIFSVSQKFTKRLSFATSTVWDDIQLGLLAILIAICCIILYVFEEG